MTNQKIRKLIVTGFFVALGLTLPTAFHLVGAGTVFLPMHIPVLICGLVCGWQYGIGCGLLVPLLSSLLTGMPPIFPVAPSMMLELGAYGALTGLFYRSKGQDLYPSLLAAMVGGRVVSGVANTVFLGMAGRPYGFAAFLSGAFVTALPGILLQLVMVPALVYALQRCGVVTRPAVEEAGVSDHRREPF